MKKSTVVLTLGMLFILACKSEDPKLEEFYKDDYSIGHPNDWDVDTSGQMNTSVLLFSQLAYDSDDFKENVNVMTQSLGGQNISVEQYGEISKNQLKAVGEVLNGELVRSGEDQKYIMEWKAFMDGHDLKFKQFYFVKNNKAYVVTFTAKEDEYNDYIETGTKILESFKLN